MEKTLQRRRFCVDEFYRLAEAGILAADERLELVDGAIVVMTPIGRRHATCVTAFQEALSALVPRATLRVQLPILLDPESEPEPDLALVRRREDRYLPAHPGPADVFLLVEVSRTTLAYDREVKLPLYARAGIPEVWIADLAGDRLEIYRDPRPDAYTTVGVLARNDAVAPVAFPDLRLTVGDLLP